MGPRASDAETSERESPRIQPVPPSVQGRSKLPTGLFGDLRLDDFDALQGLSPLWEEHYSQIGRGRADIRVAMATTEHVQIGYVARSPGLRVRGWSTSGTSALAIPLSTPLMYFQGSAWTDDRFVYCPRGTEYEAVGALPHRILAAAVDHERLDTEAIARWGRPMPLVVSGACLRVRSPVLRQNAIRVWTRWIVAGTRHPEMLLDASQAAQMEDDVLGSFLDAVELDTSVRPVTPRRQVAFRGDAFIRETLGEPTTIEDIRCAVGTSARTLHESFRETFGVSPKAYQMALRLDEVRRDLLARQPGTTISAVATRWGFSQLGIFAAYYRRMFGETPRNTLRAAHAGKSGRPR